jgi:hypothetical protein
MRNLYLCLIITLPYHRSYAVMVLEVSQRNLQGRIEHHCVQQRQLRPAARPSGQ